MEITPVNGDAAAAADAIAASAQGLDLPKRSSNTPKSKLESALDKLGAQKRKVLLLLSFS